jgi:pimeloyl-ACP methyl ester carboxylesterase
MSSVEVNGVSLYYEVAGEGEPLALVHGSWSNAMSWAGVVPGLAEAYRVLSYDRRGHSRSERPDGPGSIDEDGDDLAALLEVLELAPAHVVTSSWGGNIALRLAARRPELFRSLSCHEPPLWSVLGDDPEAQAMLAQGAESFEAVAGQIAAGDHEGAARRFVEEVIFGPGAWEHELPDQVKATFVENAPTYLDEVRDPDATRIDESALGAMRLPVRLTRGSESPPLFGRVIDRLMALIPATTHETVAGAGHVPHVTGPEQYLRATLQALEQV